MECLIHMDEWLNEKGMAPEKSNLNCKRSQNHLIKTMIFCVRFCNELQDEEIQEKNRFLNECIQDPTLRDRLSILTRTFKNRKNVIKDDPLLFTDDIFKIFPLVNTLNLLFWCYFVI